MGFFSCEGTHKEGPLLLLEITKGLEPFFKKKKKNYLFIYGCIGSSLLHAGFLQLRRAGAALRCGVRASHCGGFSCCGAQALGTRVSVVVARGLSSCGSRAQLLRGMWDLPGPGLKPMSPALAGGFLTTAPPGKPRAGTIFYCHFPYCLPQCLGQCLAHSQYSLNVNCCCQLL